MTGYRVTALTLIAAILIIAGCGDGKREPRYKKISDGTFPVPSIEFEPRRYLCRRTAEPIIIDGRLDDDPWKMKWVEWTQAFTDIEGPEKDEPGLRTRARMLWDEDYLYIGAEMKEPHVWATITGRDEVIFHDNDFEVFIDPDGDTHEYYELEINAFGTEWDLLLVKPYRDGGPAVDSWDIQGLKTAVHVDGTINNPGDSDEGWSVEIAIPWKTLGECASGGIPPEEGDIWHINMSRVEWESTVVDGRYVKKTDPETGRPKPENNWVWSPQGIVNMHYPEMWGLVMFTNVMKSFGGDSFTPAPVEDAMWVMRKIYYAEKTHFIQYGRYTDRFERLGLEEQVIHGYVWPPVIEATANLFEAVLKNADGSNELVIDHEGRLVTRDLE
ncbi:MAG: carbohydrate-binding family 9-like protein [Candidatus Krumholzibacteria bacterium]|nr:carbohydrate-binding family 9-like protein [Candidatus Krumholzibacteria bacterium]